MKLSRKLQIALLNDDEGVNGKAFDLLRDLLDHDILEAVESSCDRYYLPEAWEENPSP